MSLKTLLEIIYPTEESDDEELSFLYHPDTINSNEHERLENENELKAAMHHFMKVSWINPKYTTAKKLVTDFLEFEPSRENEYTAEELEVLAQDVLNQYIK